MVFLPSYQRNSKLNQKNYVQSGLSNGSYGQFYGGLAPISVCMLFQRAT
jgi:hypothetical protein